MSNVTAEKMTKLDTKPVESTTLSPESVDNVNGGDGLALGILGVCDGVSDTGCRRRGEVASRQLW
jgi:hypothetical protein